MWSDDAFKPMNGWHNEIHSFIKCLFGSSVTKCGTQDWNEIFIRIKLKHEHVWCSKFSKWTIMRILPIFIIYGRISYIYSCISASSTQLWPQNDINLDCFNINCERIHFKTFGIRSVHLYCGVKLWDSFAKSIILSEAFWGIIRG